MGSDEFRESHGRFSRAYQGNSGVPTEARPAAARSIRQSPRFARSLRTPCSSPKRRPGRGQVPNVGDKRRVAGNIGKYILVLIGETWALQGLYLLRITR